MAIKDFYPIERDKPHMPTWGSQYVPYQICPKCHGQGIVSIPPYVSGDILQWSSTTLTNFVCNVCNGDKIIPHCLIKNNL